MAFSAKRAVAGMSVLNAVAMVGGTAQAMVVARAFGTSRAYDLYLLVVVLPELLMIFTQNLFAAVLLPLFHKLQADYDEAAAWRRVWNVVNVSLAAYALAAVALFAFAHPIAAALAGKGTAAEVSYAAGVLRIYAPAICLSLMLRTFLSLHNACESFVFPAITNLLPPLFVIASVLAWAPRVGPYAIAYGAVAAAAAQVAFLTFRVIARGLKHWRPRIQLGAPEVRVFLAWVTPVAFGAAAEQIATFIDRQVAASLGLEGAVSSLKYGFVLSSFAIAFFSVPLARVTFTFLSRDAAREARDQITDRFNQVVRQLVVFYIPATVGLILLAEPLMRFLYVGGRFGEESLALAKPAVRAYASGLLFLVCLNLVRYVAYSYKRYLAFTVIAAAAVAGTYGLDLVLSTWFGYWGIALTRGVIALAWGLAVYVYLSRTEGLRLRAAALQTLGKALAAVVPMTALVWWMSRISWGVGFHPRLEPLVVTLTSAAAGGALYFGLLWLFREREVSNLATALLAKLKPPSA